jgi:hypothetical protein
MFVTGSDVKYNKTPQQLSLFLQHLCKQEKLECGPDGMVRSILCVVPSFFAGGSQFFSLFFISF